MATSGAVEPNLPMGVKDLESGTDPGGLSDVLPPLDPTHIWVTFD